MLSPTSRALFLTRRHSNRQKRFVFIDESNTSKLSPSFQPCVHISVCILFSSHAFCSYSLYGSRYAVQELFLQGGGVARLTK